MFSTRTNKLEIDIEAVEKKEKEIQELRDRMGHNVFKRAYVQLRRRTAFMATPPRIWLFLILLGIFSALSLYVVVGRCTGAVVAHCRAVRVPVTVRLSHGSNVKCWCRGGPLRCRFSYDSLLFSCLDIKSLLRARFSQYVGVLSLLRAVLVAVAR